MKRFSPGSEMRVFSEQLAFDSETARLIAEMPKAELHLHLDGSLRVSTALNLAATRGLDAPRDYAGMFKALTRGPHLSSQEELLKAFELPVLLLQDEEALERVTTELIDSKAADRVRYAEIKWAPTLHTRRGLTIEQVISAVCRARREGMRRTGVEVCLVCVAVRSDSPEETRRVAEIAAEFQDDGVVALDLAGDEERFPDPRAHQGALELARAAGMRITVHAGEMQDGGLAVRRALELGVERIAHGANAVSDPQLCGELRERAVMLDVCPTSNVQAATFPTLADHPVAILHRRGVPVSISTDDATISNVTLSEEWRAVVAATGLTLAELWAINIASVEAAFADEQCRAALAEEFAQWARWIPEVNAGRHP